MPTTITAILVIGLGIAPGYLFLWSFRKKTSHFTPLPDVELVVATIAAGVVIHALAFPFPGRRVWTLFRSDQLESHVGLLILWGAIVIFILPFAMGYLLGALVDRLDDRLRCLGLDSVSRSTDAWGRCLGGKEGSNVLVWLIQPSGTVVAGEYGRTSASSNFAKDGDLYLQRTWSLDANNDFVAVVPHSEGVWIPASNIARLEFIRGDDVPINTSHTSTLAETTNLTTPAKPTPKPIDNRGRRPKEDPPPPPPKVPSK